jgi:cytochrome P450
MTLTESLQGVVSAWLVAGATAAAAIAMALYLLWTNPPLRRELREREYRDP